MPTTDELDALPTRSLAQVIEKRRDEPWAWDYSYFEKFGREWTELDPADRDDGEHTVQSGYLVNKALGFGKQDPTYGEVVVLFVPPVKAG